MRQLHRPVSIALAILFAAISPLPASAEEEGVTADTIWFGQAAALAGPSSALGQGMRQGILAAFEQVNAAGGIHGRKLKLVSRDDGYDPDRSIYQTKRLLEQDKVFALIGAVGTPTAIATIPLSGAKNVPLIGPFTGAEFLRSPEVKNVINIRASYGAEAESWIQHLTEDLHFKRIAIFYQDDSFGRDGLRGVKRALEKRGLELAAEGTFERNTRAVNSALRTIERSEPEAVVMVGTYGPCAEFIKLAHKRDFNPTFVNISFVGANALARELGAEGNGVIVSQVVPFPWDTSLELVADYQAAEKAIDPTLTPDFVSLEGYLSGRLAAAALELVGPNPTRAGLLQTIRDVGRFDIGGNIITFGQQARDEPPKVFLTMIQPDGSFKSIDRLSKDATPEVGLQALFLRSTVNDKPGISQVPDFREDANARVQDCLAKPAGTSSDGAPCEQTKASAVVAVAVQTDSSPDQASSQTTVARPQVARKAKVPARDPRDDQGAPPVQQVDKDPPKNLPKNLTKNLTKNLSKNLDENLPENPPKKMSKTTSKNLAKSPLEAPLAAPPKHQSKDQPRNQPKHQPKTVLGIARAAPPVAHRQPAPQPAKSAYSFAFSSSCSCSTRGF